MSNENVEENKYLESFPKEKGIRKAALERAWSNRDFEISLFWKRAAYFWVFIALSYTGLFKEFISNDIVIKLTLSLICITLSFIWILVQIGSKRWQENWESHIDMLEDKIEGPIYKFVTKTKYSFSVSKLSMCVSGINFLFSSSVLGYILFKAEDISICYRTLIPVGLIIVLFLIGFFTKTNKTSKVTEFYLRKNSLA
jgi:hypothetical protein